MMIRPGFSRFRLTSILHSLCGMAFIATAADSSAQEIEFVSMFGESGDQTGQFNRPTAVAVDNQGQIFIAERNNSRVQICDYQGNCTQFGHRGSGPGEFTDPQGIAVDSQGRILVAEAEGGDRIQMLDQQGNWISFIGDSGFDVGEFSEPAGLAVDGASRIIVSELGNDRVQICSFDGVCSAFGRLGSGIGMFNYPRAVTLDHQGRIIVADWNNQRIQICNDVGNCSAFGSFGSAPGQFNNPAGVAVDSLNRIIVADRDNHRIQICDEQGACKAYGRFGTGPGEFSRPLGITVDSMDRIIVAERDNNRVQILQITDTADGLQINPGLNDAWFSPATSGQGFLITVFPEIQQMFLAWFTFDTERPPEDVTALLGEPGHRWLTAQGPYEGDTAHLTVFVTQGGVFDVTEPVPSTDPGGDGTMTLEFADCTEGLVNYEINSLGISGDIPIQRISPDNVALCETLTNP